MNICLLTETQSGCYKWRGAIPAKYLSQRGHKVQILSNQTEYEAPDVLVLYRAHYPQAVKVVEWCKKNNIRIVFDTDDALDLVPPENLNYKAVQSRLPLYEFLLRSADVVTTTTDTLASYLRKWNPQVTVIPNSVDPDEWTCRTQKRGSHASDGPEAPLIFLTWPWPWMPSARCRKRLRSRSCCRGFARNRLSKN